MKHILWVLLLLNIQTMCGVTAIPPGLTFHTPPGSWLLGTTAHDGYLLLFRWGPHARALASPRNLDAFWGSPGKPSQPMGCTLSHPGGTLTLVWQARGPHLWQLDLASQSPLSLEITAGHPAGGGAAYELLGEDLWGRDHQALLLLHSVPRIAWENAPSPRALCRLDPQKPLQILLLLSDDYPGSVTWPPLLPFRQPHPPDSPLSLLPGLGDWHRDPTGQHAMTPSSLSVPHPSWADRLGARFLWNHTPPPMTWLPRTGYTPGMLFLIHLCWGKTASIDPKHLFEQYLPLWWDALNAEAPDALSDENGNGLPEGSSDHPFLSGTLAPGTDRVGLSALWLLDGETLLQWGEHHADPVDQKALAEHLQDGAEALNKTLWQDDPGAYRDREHNGTWCGRESLEHFFPLATMAPSPSQRQKLLDRLLSPGLFRQPAGFCLNPLDSPPLLNPIDPWSNLIILHGLLRSGATRQAQNLSSDLEQAAMSVWNKYQRGCSRFLLSGAPSGRGHQARSFLLFTPLFAPLPVLPPPSPFCPPSPLLLPPTGQHSPD